MLSGVEVGGRTLMGENEWAPTTRVQTIHKSVKGALCNGPARGRWGFKSA